MTIEERVRDLRKQKGLSQEQFAEILGVSRQAVSKWESGQSMPEVEKLIAMSELFEVTIDYILKGEAPPKSAQDDKRRVMRLASQIISAVATMLLLVSIIAAVQQLKYDIYGALVIESVGIMALLIGFFLAGCRAVCKPLLVINVLLAGVLPSMMVPVSWLELKGQKTVLSVEWFYRTPGVFLLFTATYIVLCGVVLYFMVIRKSNNRHCEH